MRKIVPKSRINPYKIDDRKEIFDSIRNTETALIVLEAQRAWDGLDKFRKDMIRCRNYTYGNQWGDMIKDPSTGKTITEEEYIKAQGKVPLKNNMIRQLVKSVVGQFASNQTEPVCVASDRDEQKLGEMMSIIMKYLYSINRLWDMDRRTFEKYVISGLVCHKIKYGWNSALNKEDSFVFDVDNRKLFFDNIMSDYRYWDCNLIGEIHDMSISDLISKFSGNNRKRAMELREIYKTALPEYIRQSYETLTSKRIDDISFLCPSDPNMCRVIEVWRRESKERYKCHDQLRGEYYKIDIEDINKIDLINQSRIDQGLSQGIPIDEIPIITTEWFIDRYWYARWLSPFGDVLMEMETPYWHKSHPYVISIYPFIDGEVHSFVGDVIDQQRYINRLITMIDFIMGASAKGILLFPEDQIPDGMTIEDIADEWSRYNGIIMFKPKPGSPMPQQISTNATNVGAYELLNLQMRLLEEISGVHGAIQGKKAASGTAASLYAQEAQNSALNLVDLLSSYNTFREDRDTKLMQVTQQYYKDKRYINIAGNEYSEESKYIDPDKVRNVQFDLTITESQTTPAFRQQTNEFLMQLFGAGQISIEDLLENGAFPFADRLLQSIEKKKQEMQEMQQQMQQVGNTNEQIQPNEQLLQQMMQRS